MERLIEHQGNEGAISRRSFLGRGATATGALALAAAPVAARAAGSKHQLAVFRLDPEWNGAAYCQVDEGAKPDGCHGCHACHLHAANKLFASTKAADDGRAHLGCRCLVTGAGTLPRGTWVALFGNPKHPRRTSVDRRNRRTRQILKNSG